jgi:hypothetical protein
MNSNTLLSELESLEANFAAGLGKIRELKVQLQKSTSKKQKTDPAIIEKVLAKRRKTRYS